MRVHISLDEELVRELDEIAGERGRSAYVKEAVQQRLERDRRWRKIEAALGSIADTGHEWDEDPARWVHEQRRLGERPLPR
jgi:metal-responsive CopG/Arc/MetJ family transcriptional regulator